eukprot:143819-Chlamydomonas_euryale.AAC.1
MTTPVNRCLSHYTLPISARSPPAGHSGHAAWLQAPMVRAQARLQVEHQGSPWTPWGCQCFVIVGPASTADSSRCPCPKAPRRPASCRHSSPLLRHFSHTAVVASGLRPPLGAAGGTSAPLLPLSKLGLSPAAQPLRASP